MNNRFDFRRFIQVMWYTWVTQSLLPYIAMAVSALLVFLYLSLGARNGNASFYNNDSFLAFTFYFLGCGWLYAGLMFGEFSKRSTTGFYLHLPASITEKWLAKVLLTFIVFPTVLCFFFRLSYWGFNELSARLLAFRYLPFEWGSRNMQVIFFLFFLSLPAAFASGLIWRRFGIFKGIVVVFGLFLALALVADIGFGLYPYQSTHSVLLQEVNIPFFELDSPDSTRTLVMWFWALAIYIPSLLFFVATWFFMKEKEI
jgi:hypothetical protein